MEITSKELYKARPQIMGIAATLVILGHLQIGVHSYLIESFYRFPQIGVDIFFFLSGIGCYQSISKRNTLDFYYRRIKRVIPVYLLIFIGYGIFKCLYEETDILTYWRAHSIFMFPIDGQTRHWFVFGILVTYLLTPIFYKMIGHTRFWITFIIIILASSQVWFSPWPVPDNIYIFNELFITRIPVYMLGMYFGNKFSKNEAIVINSSFYLKLIGIILLIFWNNYFNQINTMTILHYLSIPGAMYITFFLTMVFNKIKILPLKWLGQASLEFYLVNEKIVRILTTYKPMSLIKINVYGFILTFIIAITLGLIINKNKKQYLLDKK